MMFFMKKAILAFIMALSALATPAQNVVSFVNAQMQEYPKSRLLDIYKSCFQDYMGTEYLT